MTIFDDRKNFKPFEYPDMLKFGEAISHSYWLHCVGPEERVCTDKGMIKVIDLYNNGEDLTLFNNKESVSSSKMIKTGVRNLYKIHTKEGFTHTVTKDHRVMTTNGWTEAKDLKEGDRLVIQTKEGLFGKVHCPERAFLQGHFQGNGSNINKKRNIIMWSLWSFPNQYGLIEYMEYCLKKVYQDNNLFKKVPKFGKEYVPKFSKIGYRRMISSSSHNLFSDKNVIPEFVWRGDKETVWSYIKGLLYTDGTVSQTKKHQGVHLSQTNIEFLKDVQILLSNLGIKSYLTISKNNKRLLPDAKGGNKEYICKNIGTLSITNGIHVKLIDDNTDIFAYKGKIFRNSFNEKKSHPIIEARFSHLEPIGKSDVYCVSVHNENKSWICNGFVTHNTEWSFMSDIQDFKTKLNEKEKNAIKNAMLAIAQIEVSVKDFWGKLGNRIPKPEASMVGYIFAESECRHAMLYSKLLEVLNLNGDFELLLQNPVIQGRVDYLTKYLKGASQNSKQEYALSLTLFSLFIENVSLFSQFLLLMSFNKHKNFLKDISNGVQATIKEECVHADFGIYLTNIIKEEYPEWMNEEFYAKIKRACLKAYEAEAKIIDWIFEKGDLDFVSADGLKRFIKGRFNDSVVRIGGEKVFDISDEDLKEFKWFEEELFAPTNIDFFNKKSVAYSKNVQAITSDNLF